MSAFGLAGCRVQGSGFRVAGFFWVVGGVGVRDCASRSRMSGLDLGPMGFRMSGLDFGPMGSRMSGLDFGPMGFRV